MVSDAEAIADILVCCWQSAYTGLIDPAYPRGLSVDKYSGMFKDIIRLNRETVFVYETEGSVIGFISGMLSPGKYDVEVKGLYVKQVNQGTGIGSSLLRYMKDFFVSTGCKTMIIWTLLGAKNNKFYRVNGGIAKETKLLQIGDRQYSGVGFSYFLNK